MTKARSPQISRARIWRLRPKAATSKATGGRMARNACQVLSGVSDIGSQPGVMPANSSAVTAPSRPGKDAHSEKGRGMS